MAGKQAMSDDRSTAPPRRRLMPVRRPAESTLRSAPMTTAGLVFAPDGAVAWDRIWGSFCGLALAGGSPHRGTPLTFADADAGAELDVDGRGEAVRREIARALMMVTGWPADTGEEIPPGRVELRCPDADAAAWMARAVHAENVATAPCGERILLPAGATFRLDGEIRNVVTAVAKSHHYWLCHAASLRGDQQSRSVVPSSRA